MHVPPPPQQKSAPMIGALKQRVHSIPVGETGNFKCSYLYSRLRHGNGCAPQTVSLSAYCYPNTIESLMSHLREQYTNNPK